MPKGVRTMSTLKKGRQKKEKKEEVPDNQRPKTWVALRLSIPELTLIYELMHDVKYAYRTMSKYDQRKDNAKEINKRASKIMEKIEKKVLMVEDKDGKK
jgi:predicted histidine transporter YuiF (NhaC family)|tara:strand:+ start:84 stop:380 length:297 start_codon:yes stop_codon:yes gene_type:complete